MLFKKLLLGLSLIVFNFQVYAQDVSLEWVHGIGGNSEDNARCVVTDDQGNVYVAGTFRDTVDFDPGSGSMILKAPPQPFMSECFVAKYSASGSLVWIKQTTTLSTHSWSHVSPWAIELDNNKNVVVVGASGGDIATKADTVDFDPGAGLEIVVFDSTHTHFVWKLDNNGNHIWAKKIGGVTENGRIPDLAIDSTNAIYLSGHFNDTTDFDPGGATFNMYPLSPTGCDVFICKLDSIGNFVWARQQPGVLSSGGNHGFLKPISVAISKGNLYLGSTFIGTENFRQGSSTILLSNGGDPLNGSSYVLKLNLNGDLIWAKNFRNTQLLSNANTLKALRTDRYDNIYIVGGCDGDVDFDPGVGNFFFESISNPFAQGHTYIVKLNSLGNFVWAKRLTAGGTAGIRTSGLSTDNSGNVYLTGVFGNQNNDFDPGNNPNDTFYLSTLGGSFVRHTFVTKLDTSGQFKWAKRFFSSTLSGHENYGGIDVDYRGNVFTVGAYYGPTNFDPGPDTTILIPVSLNYDIFIHKMSCVDTTGNQVITDTAICRYAYGDSIYTESGTYHYYLLQESGCRSTITLELTITPIEVSISVDGFVLSTRQPYSSYQWFLNGNPIPGATGATYTVTENGDYSVVVTNEEGCTGTSETYTIDNVSVTTLPNPDNKINIYPNPNSGQVFIQSASLIHNAELRFTNLLGQIIINRKGLSGNRFVFDISSQPAGIYFIEIEENGQVSRVKLVKE